VIETDSSEPVRGIDLHLFQNTMTLAGSSSNQEVCHLLTRYTAHALVSDICLLLSPPDEDGQVHLISAYDLIVQESFSPLAFDHNLIPGYAEALENGTILQVSDDTSEKISLFAHLIMVERIYSMLVFPVIGSEGKALAAVCLVSPYSKHVWTEEEHYYLQDSSSAIAAALERTLAQPGDQPPALESLTQQLEHSENERSRLMAEMEAISGELAALSIIAEEDSTEKTDQQESEERLAALKASLEVLEGENDTLKQQIAALEDSNNEFIQKVAQLEEEATASPAELEDLSKKLQEALKRARDFETQLDQAKAQLEFLGQGDVPANGNTLSTEQAEVIASIAQELRQPMSSISGYTDLLISESVGILGALQKKFLERVKASTDRMNHLIGDLIQITTLDSGSLAFTPQPVEVIEIVDAAIENTSGQFREKDIALRVDISPDLPKMHTDKDALQQILLHLLQNAGAATHEEGEIHVKVEPYNKTENDIILIAVSDSGEGIPREDLPRVFSRLYRADNPLIPGVGDTGVGLSIAKTLTEALGGRIWVESDQGVGSTFSVLLPVTTQTVNAAEG
jgi:signal transduction histidine kinase